MFWRILFCVDLALKLKKLSKVDVIALFLV